ncbi:MAG: hypothetical protein R2705_21810 [Ilumatobacteraceae bacterium]
MNQALTDGAAQSGLTNYVVLDMAQSMNGHRLCENTVGLLEERIVELADAGAADQTEWVAQIRTAPAVFGPYEVQESIHLATGSARDAELPVRAYDDGAIRGGTCTSTGGVNALGEPNMSLG